MSDSSTEKKGRGLWIAGLFAVLAVAGLLRLSALDVRPMHGDEANQAYKAWTLLEDGSYEYDPFEHHGPTLYYFVQGIFWLGGDVDRADITETQLRLLPALFGVASVLLVAGFARAIGPWAAMWAALFTAVSHAMVFYSGYFIQEQIFTFFMIAAVYFGWRYFQTCCPGRAVAAGLCIGLLHATKETCVVLYAAMAGGLIVVWLAGRGGEARAKFRMDHAAAFLAAALGVSVLLFSSFFTHWRGVLDSVLTYGTYLGRAEGEGSSALHHHPWWYYFDLLLHYDTVSPKPLWTEGVVLLLAAIGLPIAIWRGLRGTARFPLFLAVFALLLTAAFCVIPYKTPWNLLPFFQALILIAGIGAAALVRAGKWMPLRALIVIALLAGAGHLAYQARIGTTLWSADPRNPYVYAHTSTRLVELAERVHDIAAASGKNDEIFVAVISQSGDYWPLPWYLRDLPNVGYYFDVDEALAAEGVDMIIGGANEVELIDAGLGEDSSYSFAGISSIRPGVLIYPYVSTPLWEAYMDTRR